MEKYGSFFVFCETRYFDKIILNFTKFEKIFVKQEIKKATTIFAFSSVLIPLLREEVTFCWTNYCYRWRMPPSMR